MSGAGAREDQPRARRRPAARRRQARARDRLPARRPRRPRSASSLRPRRRVEGFADGHDRPRARSTALRRRRTAGGCGSRSASRSRPGSAAAAPTRRRRFGSRTRSCAEPLDGRASCTRSPRGSAPTCRSSSTTGPQLGTGRRHASSSRSTCRRTSSVLLLLPHGARSGRRPRSTRAFDARGGERGYEERAAALRAALARGAPAARPRRAAAERPRALAARRRAARPRCLPRRRQRRRAGRLRRSSHDRADAQAAQRALEAPRAALDHGSCVVRLTRDGRCARDRARLDAPGPLAARAPAAHHPLDRGGRGPALPRRTSSTGGRRSRSP